MSQNRYEEQFSSIGGSFGIADLSSFYDTVSTGF